MMNDRGSIALLLVLYTLQGIPMGLSGSIPFLLTDKVSYSQQALFSLVSLPFSLKLLWAPLVDSTYIRRFGRRKCWLVPVQMACGFLMLAASTVINDWVGETGSTPNVKALTAYFFMLYFLMATQDIAVDGWALTMLSEKNVGYASTCNSIGQTVGFFASQVGFLALNDATVCNKYFRSRPSDQGLVSLGAFMSFWAIVFIITTLYVCFFKRERAFGRADDSEGLLQSYTLAWACLNLAPVKRLCLILLTCKIAFAVTDSATSLKLVEYGMPKEELAMLSPALVVFGILIPVWVGRYTAGPEPLNIFLYGYPLRILCGIMYACVLPLTRPVYMVPGTTPYYFYSALITAVIVHEIGSNMMFVSQMAFYAKVSDPAIGGTYMTLLNTISNLGSKWPNSASLYIMDYLTHKECTDELGHIILKAQKGVCQASSTACQDASGSCVVVTEGYYVQVVLCTAIGLVWLVLFKSTIQDLQRLPQRSWRLDERTA